MMTTGVQYTIRGYEDYVSGAFVFTGVTMRQFSYPITLAESEVEVIHIKNHGCKILNEYIVQISYISNDIPNLDKLTLEDVRMTAVKEVNKKYKTSLT